MLVSFVYLVACRLFALVLLLARGDRSNELELLVLRHELSILRRQARRPQLTESDRLFAGGAEPADTTTFVARVPHHARDPGALAPTDRRAPVDVRAPTAGSATNRSRAPRVDPTTGAEER